MGKNRKYPVAKKMPEISEFRFRTETGTMISDVVKYINNWRVDHAKFDPRIYIATDSQNKKRCTIYSTAIVMRYGIRGAHVIYHREKVSKIKDRWSRLYREALMTGVVAMHLKSNAVSVERLELDYNSKDKKYGSYNVISAGKGYLNGLGFMDVSVKPEEQIAAKAADHYCDT